MVKEKSQRVNLRFHGLAKTFPFQADPQLNLKAGDVVIAEGDNGPELGVVSIPTSWQMAGMGSESSDAQSRHSKRYAESDWLEAGTEERTSRFDLPSRPLASLRTEELPRVLRLATPQDEQTYAANCVVEEKAFAYCREQIQALKIEMSLVAVEYSLNRSKLLFYFTAEGRVDFRALVRQLAQQFRTRIELRQIGVRDEARMVGGLGVCGRELCCKSYINKWIPVNIKMAKEQGLSVHPRKVSGCCGRLLCCLKYEYETYLEAKKRMPVLEQEVQTPEGKGVVKGLDYLGEKVHVLLNQEEEKKTFTLEQLQFVPKKKSGRKSTPSTNRAKALDEEWSKKASSSRTEKELGED